MSSLHCPYCKVKEIVKAKSVFDAIEPFEGNCPDCGSWLDKGQTRVLVNSYIEIYKGALRLMDKMVDDFNYWLDYFGVDVKDYFVDDQESAIISVSTSDIIDELFLGYAGGTTKSNFKRALGIEEDFVEFELNADHCCY